MRKTYFEVKKNCDLPVAIVSYCYKDFDDMIRSNSFFADFNEDEINIKEMEIIKNKYGKFFMFFNNSNKGIKFWKNNPITHVTIN